MLIVRYAARRCVSQRLIDEQRLRRAASARRQRAAQMPGAPRALRWRAGSHHRRAPRRKTPLRASPSSAMKALYAGDGQHARQQRRCRSQRRHGAAAVVVARQLFVAKRSSVSIKMLQVYGVPPAAAARAVEAVDRAPRTCFASAPAALICLTRLMMLID